MPGATSPKPEPPLHRRPLVALALAWALGIAGGRLLDHLALWLALAAVFITIALLMLALRRPRGVQHWGLLAAIALAAAWLLTWDRYTRADDIRQYLGTRSQLAEVTGVVEGPSYVTTPQRGAMGRFSYKSPGTLVVLRLESIRLLRGESPASGKIILKISQADYRLRAGDRVRATGWLAAIDPPVNPGEVDYRAMLADRGIYGRITLHSRDNWTLISHATGWSRLAALSQTVSDAAASSLRLGMKHEPARAALLETLLLGRWNPDLQEIDESFRRVGLAHILSISGAHLTILLGLVWIIGRMIWADPRYAAGLALVVLAWYLLVVPPQVPLWRSAVMSGVFCLGYASGRRVRGVDLLAMAAIIVLIWRPADLFNAGAQLSFLGVASLLLFARPFSLRIWSEPLVRVQSDRWRVGLCRFGADYVASNVVASSLSVPLVAYHFSLISPLAIVLSILALPVVTAVLAVGFLKMAIGLALPSAGVVLAGPLAWFADCTILLVEHAATWPGASVQLTQAPTLTWTLTATLVVIACFAGWFAGRRWAVATAVAVCVLWLAFPAVPAAASSWLRPVATRPALSLHMFAVGDGSCFLVRCPDPQASEDNVLMFDCGSQEYLDVGQRSIGPALRSLGVHRIDTLVVSHADLDHFSGVLDVMDQVKVSRVLVPPQLVAEANAQPGQAAAALLEGVRLRGVPIVEVSRGWQERAGGAELEMLWPASDLRAKRANDTSLVLSIRAAGRRVLLNGDIQDEPIRSLLSSGMDLRADVTDLPHHGSFVDSSPRWLDAVKPRVVLQSSGEARLLHDKWKGVIGGGTQRFITRRHGMVSVEIGSDGALSWRAFRELE